MSQLKIQRKILLLTQGLGWHRSIEQPLFAPDVFEIQAGLNTKLTFNLINLEPT